MSFLDLDLNNLEDFFIYWNSLFPFDRSYRKKYNIGFLSKEHLNLNQIEIALDALEDDFFISLVEERKALHEKREKFDKGEWLNSKIEAYNEEELSNMLDKVNLDNFDNVKFDYKDYHEANPLD